MRKVVVDEWMTLDGVVQAPSYPDEDDDGGFRHGGWHNRFFDDQSRQWVVEGIAGAGAYLFGRRTYGNFAAYWPNAGPEEAPLAGPLNSRPKYVASTTLSAPLDWSNSTLLQGDIGSAVTALKNQDGGDLHVVGSAALARSLFEHDLVDELRLMIDPIIVGGGKRVFPDSGRLTTFRMSGSQVTSTGAILACFSAR